MASKKGQVVLATKPKSFSTFAAKGDSVGATTRSNAKAVTTLEDAPSKLVSLREQGECRRCELVIILASLRAQKHASVARDRTSRSNKQNSSASKKTQIAPIHVGKNVTAFTTRRDLASIVSRESTKHTTPALFTPKSHEDRLKNRPTIHFITKNELKAFAQNIAAIAHPSKSGEVHQKHKPVISLTLLGAKKVISRGSERCLPKSKNLIERSPLHVSGVDFKVCAHA